MNKIIALDIGGVCMRLTYERCLEKLGFSEMALIPAEFLASCDLLERGETSEEEWLKVYHSVTDGRFSDQDLLHAWNLILGEDMPGMPELVAEIVDSGYRFVFFSDTSRLHLLQVYRQLSFANLVTGGIFSFEVGAKKPEGDMYESFEKTYGKPCFYIDDKAENIAGGEEHGWTSHQFTSAESFQRAFDRVKGSH